MIEELFAMWALVVPKWALIFPTIVACWIIWDVYLSIRFGNVRRKLAIWVWFLIDVAVWSAASWYWFFFMIVASINDLFVGSGSASRHNKPVEPKITQFVDLIVQLNILNGFVYSLVAYGIVRYAYSKVVKSGGGSFRLPFLGSLLLLCGYVIFAIRNL